MKRSIKFGWLGLVFNLLCIAYVPVAHAQLRGNNDSLMVSSDGFLWNRALQYTNLSKFKGDVRDSIADAPLIRQVLFEAQQAQVHSNFPNIEVLQRKSDSCWLNSNTVLLQYFVSSFNKYQDSAFLISQNWDSIKHCFVYPQGNRMSLQSDTLMIFGSLLEKVNQANLKIILDSNLIQKNWKNKLQFFISIDDTLHYINLPIGLAVNCFLDSSFSQHTFYLKVKGLKQEWYSAYRFTYQKSSVLFPSPDQIIGITSSIPFKGKLASLEMGVWKSCLNTALLNQPVIIVEGFDPQNVRTLLASNSAENNLYCVSNASVVNKTNMLDSLRAYGHDVVIVDFVDGGTYVENNALALVEALKYINSHKEGKDELVVVGASMGGLISRYALLYMERNLLEHHCRLWVSFDSPHNGANVPIGLQMMIDFIYDNLSNMPYAVQNQIPQLRDKVLNCPAAREMLLTHYSMFKYGSNGPCSEFNALYDTLNKWGFPSCRKVSIADGNYYGADQGFNAGQDLVHFLLPLYPLTIDMKASAVPLGVKTQTVFEGSIKTYVKGWPVNLVKSNYLLHSGNGIDNSAGGSNSFHIDVANSLGISKGQSVLGTCLMEEDNFVPVSSALAIQGNPNYQSPVSSIMPNLSYLGTTHSSSICPFDVSYCMKNYYSSSRNTTINNGPHVIGGFDRDMMQLINKEVMSRNCYLQNLKWTSTHEMEAITISAGAHVSNWISSGDFECNTNADAVIRAVDQIHLQDGVKILHPYNCHLTTQASFYDPNCIQVTSSAAFRNLNPSKMVLDKTEVNSKVKLMNIIEAQPNPSNARFVLKFAGLNSGIQVMDMVGRVILIQSDFHSGDALNMEAYPDGIYFIRLINNPFSITKIIKQSYE